MITPAPTTRRWFSIRRIVAIVSVVAVVGFVLLFAIPPKSAFAPLPDPNGYHVLVQAAAKIEPGSPDMSIDEMAALLAANKAAMDEIRRALDLPCAVPVQMEQRWLRTHTAELSSFRRAANAFDREAAFLQEQNATTEALDRCLELARFSHAICENGLLVTALVGMACESIAIKRMIALLPSLSAIDCKKAARALHEYDVRRESADEIAGREAEWSRRAYGALAQIQLMFRSGALRANKAAIARTEARFQSQSREARLLILKVAARGFELEHGRKPQRSAELVPAFLPSVPVDPATQAPLALP